jgi:Domain of unknown function (DUF4326)
MPNIKPKRLQRSRKRGMRIPDGAINVCRPTLWGNPFTAQRFGHAKCVILHKAWLTGELGDFQLEQIGFCAREIEALTRKRASILIRLHELTGKDLVCWCPVTSPWCHAETYLALASDYAETERLAA